MSATWPAPMMYHGTVRRLPFREQLRAAALAGCATVTIGAWEYRALRRSGVSARDMRAAASDEGVAITHLDPFVTWVPNWQPAEMVPDFPVEALDCQEDELCAIADELGLRSLTVAATFTPGSISRDELVDLFGGLCHRLQSKELQCDLEFVPFSAIKDLPMAWDIVAAVSAPNGHIMLDFLHFVRSGSSLDLLRTVPGKWIGGVQINDGPRQLPEGTSLIEEAMMGRMPIGEGAFPIEAIVRTLAEIGGLNKLGPEIFSHAFDGMCAEDIAAECRRSIARVRDMAGI